MSAEVFSARVRSGDTKALRELVAAVRKDGWVKAAAKFGVEYKTLNRWCHEYDHVAKALAPYRTVRG